MSRIVLVLSLAASVGLCGNAHAKHWTVCNHTSEDLNVAIAYHDTQNQTVTEGWHPLGKCSGCVVVLDYDRTDNDAVYLFAENGAHAARFQAEHPRLCIAQQAFRIRNAPNSVNCPGVGGKVVGFQKVTLPDWNKNLTTTLGSGSGSSCVDPS
jgi:uncharacterized membrane protein